MAGARRGPAGRGLRVPEQAGAVSRAQALVGWVLRSRGWRANERMGLARANILSAGIAFYGVFSLFPLLALGFTLFGQVLRSSQRLQDQVFGYMAESLPGLVGGDDALLTRDQVFERALDPSTLGLSAAIGVGVLLFTALGWIAALREGIRSVFRMPPMRIDPVRAKLWDLVVALTLGVLLVSSALVSVLGQVLTRRLVSLPGVDAFGLADVATQATVLLGTAVIDTLLFMVLYRVLAGVRQRYRGLVTGAVIAAVGVGVLRFLVSIILGGLDGRFGFLGSAVVPVLALFVWLNLTARVMLFGAAWAAVGPTSAVVEDTGVPERVPLPRRAPPALPVRWSDRAVLGAGVVLGASAVAMLQATTGAARTVGGGLRALTRSDSPR